MKSAAEPIPLPRPPRNVLLASWYHWLIPAVLIAAGVAVYAWRAPELWETSQALILRNEGSGGQVALGKFGSTEEMKTVQETVLELIRSAPVLHAALEQSGSRATPADVDELRERIKLAAPKGAEFGKTEVFYLKVRDPNPAHATALNQALCRQLSLRFQQLRDAKAASLIDELTHTVQLARADLAEASGRVAEVETKAGSDLAELRYLSESATSDSALRRTLIDISAELRQAEAAQRANEELAHLIAAAEKDPGRLLATPNRLLESQPALRRLKEGLVDAQLATARSQGKMLVNHPSVQAAREAEEEISRQLHNELALAARGLAAECRLGADRIATLQGQWNDGTQRLSKLANVRTSYTALLAECRNRETILQRAEQGLSEARAARAAAQASSLINPIDSPDAGTQPVGPGRVTIGLAGIFGGLVVGLGIWALMLPAGVVTLPALAGNPAKPRSLSDGIAATLGIVTDLARRPGMAPPN